MPDDAPSRGAPPSQQPDAQHDTPKADDKPDGSDAPSTPKPDEHITSIFDILIPNFAFLEVLNGLFVTFPTEIVDRILFAGRFGTRHTTKFTFTQINDQYKEGIKGLDAAILWSLAVIIICWSVFFLLPADKTVTIPYIGFPLSRADWLAISPAIILAMQVFFTSALLRVMILRHGIARILEAADADEIKKGDIGDVTNLHLSGFFGTLLMLLHLLSIFKKIKLIVFYWVAIGFIAVALLAPQITLLAMIVWLFGSGYYLSAIAYFVLTAIIGTAAILLMIAAIWLYASSSFLTFAGPRSAAPPKRRRGRAAGSS